ncbi:Protein of unknown function [Pyronema omphalodes CBS 100304]|uniref:Uncharacterized protein n=1 Tax=Pyronema omphalodes (strain CBS 100304) TaxID=1076935 RepID=U4LLX4_PYROM|nr:Protein of unknown function [Pyronema omphalodes CBS 100304]
MSRVFVSLSHSSSPSETIPLGIPYTSVRNLCNFTTHLIQPQQSCCGSVETRMLEAGCGGRP